MSERDRARTRDRREARRPRARRSRWPSVQTWLPLWICALLAATVAVLAGWSYSDSRQTLLATAGVQLDAAVGELGDAISKSAEGLTGYVAEEAAEPALAEALRARSEPALMAARAPLAELASLRSQAVVTELWSAGGERVLTAANAANEEPAAEVRDASSAPERAGVRPLRTIAGATYYDVVAEVRADPADGSSERLGWLVLREELRPSKETTSLLRNLIARDAVMMIGNRTGGSWTDLERPVPEPVVDPLDPDPSVHSDRDGEQRLGVGTALAGTPWVLWVETPAAPFLEPARSSLVRTGLVSLALVLAGGGGAWWISRRVTAPLRRATEAAEAIAFGRLERRVAPGGPDELQRLAHSFNLMAERIERRTSMLRRVRDQYEDLYRESPDLHVSVELASGRIVRCNETAARRLGFARNEIVGRTLAELCDPEQGRDVEAVLEEVATTGAVENAPLTLRDREQRPIPVLFNAKATRDERSGVVEARSSLRDVSDVERAESRRAAVVQEAMDAIVTIDVDGRIVEFNPAAEEMFGYTAAEAHGERLSDLIVPPRLRASHEEGLARLRATGEGPILGQRIEIEAQRRDGSELPVELAVVKLDGTDPPLYTGFVRDLTSLRRVQRDLERTIADLRRSNEDLEQFAYVASHDLQEPLRMVTLFMEMLESEYRGELDETADDYITYAVEGAQRLRRLVDGLLAYSRIDTRGRSLRRCASGEVLDEALSNLSMRIEETGATVVRGELPTVWADPTQLQQIFLNLLSNALKFHGDAPPRVSIGARRVGDHWDFVVEDEGIGFEQIHADRVFQMFQRLDDRRASGGSGIGLAVARRIVERHGGRMWVESAPGAGSRFHFSLPATRPRPHADGDPRDAAGSPATTKDAQPTGAEP